MTRLNELVKEGSIEKVSVPSKNPGAAARTVCIRLARQESDGDEQDDDIVKVQGVDEQQEEELVAIEGMKCPRILVPCRLTCL